MYNQKIYKDAERFGIENKELAKSDIEQIVEVEKTIAQVCISLIRDVVILFTKFIFSSIYF
jgi:hypothetical protein